MKQIARLESKRYSAQLEEYISERTQFIMAQKRSTFSTNNWESLMTHE